MVDGLNSSAETESSGGDDTSKSFIGFGVADAVVVEKVLPAPRPELNIMERFYSRFMELLAIC